MHLPEYSDEERAEKRAKVSEELEKTREQLKLSTFPLFNVSTEQLHIYQSLLMMETCAPDHQLDIQHRLEFVEAINRQNRYSTAYRLLEIVQGLLSD